MPNVTNDGTQTQNIKTQIHTSGERNLTSFTCFPTFLIASCSGVMLSSSSKA